MPPNQIVAPTVAWAEPPAPLHPDVCQPEIKNSDLPLTHQFNRKGGKANRETHDSQWGRVGKHLPKVTSDIIPWTQEQSLELSITDCAIGHHSTQLTGAVVLQLQWSTILFDV